MRSLLALILLINVLGYLMMTNVPPGATLVTPADKNYESHSGPVASPGTLVLLQELSDEDLAAMAAEAFGEVITENELVKLCDVLGPFADNQLAVAALDTLLPDLANKDGLIIGSPSAEYWLSIPASETPAIALNSWRQFETKKRYLEDCMEVASGLKFH
jgi:hypothetical protein|tara:strand:- start:31 stop:510 length:480 start_codon:yes stop_codon:yes gene_type:complete